MSELKATSPISLQYLINEDIYIIDAVENIQKIMETEVATASKTKPEEAVSFDYLGENNKYFLLIVDYANYPIMAPKELEALQSILGAKKMDIKDVAILNLNKYPSASFQQLKTFFAFSKVVLFGINPQQIQIPAIASNEIAEYGGAKILSTFNFAEMLENIDKKKIFWNVMKGF